MLASVRVRGWVPRLHRVLLGRADRTSRNPTRGAHFGRSSGSSAYTSVAMYPSGCPTCRPSRRDTETYPGRTSCCPAPPNHRPVPTNPTGLGTLKVPHAAQLSCHPARSAWPDQRCSGTAVRPRRRGGRRVGHDKQGYKAMTDLVSCTGRTRRVGIGCVADGSEVDSSSDPALSSRCARATVGPQRRFRKHDRSQPR